MAKIQLLVVQLLLLCSATHSQNSTANHTKQKPSVEIIARELERLNKQVLESSGDSGQGMIVTYRALNVFFANKIGSYLSEGGDLSLFNTYATVSSADGKFTLNQNFKHTGSNERIKSLTTVGTKVNLGNGFATIFDGKKFKNELGISLKQTWLLPGSVFFDKTFQTQNNGSQLPQKLRMNRIRAALIRKYINEMKEKQTVTICYLDSIKRSDVPGDDPWSVQQDELQKVYAEMEKSYLKQFATDQAKELADENNALYNAVGAWWLSLNAYIPITATGYTVAPDYLSSFADERIYPFEVDFSVNRIWESRRYGTWFFNFIPGVLLNSTVGTDAVTKTSLTNYKNLGGIDTLHFAQLSNDDAYVGKFSKFLTPSMKAQVVYFPKGSIAGISIQLEQDFGSYNPMNTKIGLPIRLSDKDGNPTVNFEVQWRVTDWTNQISSGKSIGQKSMIGLTVGLPLNSIIY